MTFSPGLISWKPKWIRPQTVKVKYREEIKELKKKKADLQSKYDKLEDAVEDKWEEVKNAFTESAGSFKAGFSRLGKLFTREKEQGKAPGTGATQKISHYSPFHADDFSRKPIPYFASSCNTGS